MSLETFVAEAIRSHVATTLRTVEPKPFMEFFGCFRDMHEENKRIEKFIEDEFERVNPEEWR